ncbi:two-component system, NarL family, sensor histidine kinase BarA [Halopseudomonas sabulinigri]|uniref:histidine kinase n=1 Tax=Halopseudomonas sabulinigri TaxID=472181 RepID=A0A1H1X137_9GAMM|nr:response regulator [Halopseudomonas sabulinigri]SDT03008.1 two-component system, NarL family, sensor histidine kinase BarA [Halopseudomonas sabulinigri]
MNEIGIKTRILLMTLVPSGLLALALGGYFSWQQLQDLEQQLLERGQMTAEHLQGPATEALLARQPERLRSQLGRTLNYQDVRAVALYDSERRLLEHSGPQMQPTERTLPESSLAAGTGLQIQASKHSTRFTLPLLASPGLLEKANRPDLEADALLGWLEVELSHGNTLLRSYQSLLATLVLILIGLVVTGLLVSAMGRRIIGPVAQINQAIARISKGQLDVRLAEQGSRELDDLASGINTMAQALQSAQGEMQQNVDQAIEDLQQTLETIEVQNIELDMARKTAQEANRIKSEFLANMSHELRTPLNGILGFSNLLERTEMSPRQQEYLGTISKSADNLLAIINEILDFSKIEAGKLVLENMPFNLRDLIQDTLTMLAPAAHLKGVELVSLIYRDTPLSLSGDQLRLKQILSNLISNAIKFTHEGSVCLRTMLEDEDDDQVTLRLSVTDTGVGLTPSQQKSLFKAFSQVDNSLSRQPGGTGLGLVITKRLVEQMQGDIGLNSVAGEGSEFWLTLRLNKSSQASDDLPSKPLQGFRVGVCEPQPLSQQALIHCLQDLGLEISLFPSLHALNTALARADGENIKLVVLGSPPAGTPLSPVIACMREWADSGRCQSILMTSTTEQNEQLDNLPSAHCMVLSKPLCTRKLFRAALHLLQPRNEAISLLADAGVERRANPDSLSVLCVDDNAANLKLVETFLREIGTRVLTVSSGEHALEVLREQRFDLIFMDVQMPGMDGRQTTEEIRLGESVSGQSPTPIIALTAHALADERRRLLKCGMNDYLSKPISPDQLRECIHKWTGQPLGRVTGGESAASSKPAPMPLVLDPEESLRLAAGKEDLAADMLDMLLADLPSVRTRIAQAAEHQDLNELLEAVHKLHGATRYCGVPELRQCCLRAETRLKEGDSANSEIASLMQAIERLLETASVE